MARQIIWAPKAQKDLLQHLDYISADSLQSAALVKDRILSRVLLLATVPTGRAGRVFGTYEVYVPKTSLIISYEVPNDNYLYVLRIIHSKRHWPKSEWPKDSS